MEKSNAMFDLALRLLKQELRAARGRRKNKEDVIMDWTLLSIGILTSILLGILLHLIWKEKSHISRIKE